MASFFCFFILFLSCQNTHSSENIDGTPTGRWLVTQAFRNGKLTSTLEKGYFHFVNDTMVSTNIFGRDLAFQSNTKGNVIKLINEIENITNEYLIELYNADSMILHTEIKNYEFRFHLHPDTLTSVIISDDQLLL